MPIPAEYRPTVVSTVPVRIELDGWTAGGDDTGDVVDSQGTMWTINTFDGWQGAPAVRTSLTERPGEHGSFDGRAFMQPRVITVEGMAFAVDRASAFRARDIIVSVCGDTGSLVTLTAYETGRPVKRALVRRSAETKTGPIIDNVFAWSMILVAPDPRRYSDTEHSQAVGLPQAGTGGLVFPLVFPLTFGSGASGGEMTLTNAGTLATWPKWTITGPVTGARIVNTGTGEELEFDPTFAIASGQTLVIDTAAKTVIQSGISRRDRLFAAQWFLLEPGDTGVRFSAISAFDAATSLTATWRDGWT